MNKWPAGQRVEFLYKFLDSFDKQFGNEFISNYVEDRKKSDEAEEYRIEHEEKETTIIENHFELSNPIREEIA